MPKDTIDYSNTIIYKIYCKNDAIADTYVGHTTNFIKRKYQHKIFCNSSKNLKIYDIIRQNGGWENWNMVEIAKYNCKDSTEARIREQEHHDLLKPSLNKLKPASHDTQTISQNDNICFVDNINPNNCKYCCSYCNYSTSKKSSYDDHLLSNKHKRMTEANKSDEKSAFLLPTHVCNKCNKHYKSRNGLWKHKKICTETTDVELYKPDLVSDKELIMMLIKDNNELRKMMMEQQSLMIESNNKVLDICKNGTNNTTHTNSHNKAFNLNFFLNETCKNAMNIMDFADSIQLQLSDLENMGKVGYVEGISNIIVKNLKALDVTERPIHCADKKREIIYIKDEDKWEKEEPDKKRMKKVINRVAFKNQRLLPKFKEAHPGCNMAESQYSDQYSKIVIEAMGGAGNNDEEKADKIIKNIAKEVTIDKKLMVDY